MLSLKTLFLAGIMQLAQRKWIWKIEMGNKKLVAASTSLRLHGELIILRQLTDNGLVKARLDKIAEEFPDMFPVPIMKYPPFYEAPGIGNKAPEFSIEKHLPDGIDKNRVEEYSLALRKLADDYNLWCDWIIGRLHENVRGLIKPESRVLHIGVSVSGSIDQLNIPVFPETRQYEDIRRSPLYKKEWQRLKSSHPELTQRQRMPDNFDLHVKWLCNRLFFGSTGRAMEARDPDNPETDWTSDYIDSMIRKTAKCLGIKLSRGRPPKSRNR